MREKLTKKKENIELAGDLNPRETVHSVPLPNSYEDDIMCQMRNTYMGSVELENILELPNESESEAEDHLTSHSFDDCES